MKTNENTNRSTTGSRRLAICLFIFAMVSFNDDNQKSDILAKKTDLTGSSDRRYSGVFPPLCLN
jgi:hypothetical protein